jgi:hypothetical protein
MSLRVQKSFIRGDIYSTEIVDVDILGRQIGNAIIVEQVLSASEKVVIAALHVRALSGQEAVISDATAVKLADPNAEVILVADLKPSK